MDVLQIYVQFLKITPQYVQILKNIGHGCIVLKMNEKLTSVHLLKNTEHKDAGNI